MRVTAIQTNTGSDLDANLADVRRLVGEAARQDNPDFVLLPEVMAFMGGSVEERRGSAEVLPGGRVYTELADLAREHRIILHSGSFLERVAGTEKVFNTSVVFDRKGNEIARYRKIHLFHYSSPGGHSYRESDVFGGGDEVVTFDADGTRIGCSICYDVRFPELYRMLADRGARVIVVPAAFTLQTGKDHWEVLLRARAIETQTYVIAAAQWGRFMQDGGSRQSYGHSMVVDPWGHILAQAHDGVGWTTARLDFAYQDQIRSNLPVHEHHVL